DAHRPGARPRRADRRDHRRGPPPAGRGRCRGALAACGRARGGDGLLGRLPVLPEPGRAAHPADHRRLRRPGCRRRGGRRPRGGAPGALARRLPRRPVLGAGAPARVRAALRLPRAGLLGAPRHRAGRCAGRRGPRRRPRGRGPVGTAPRGQRRARPRPHQRRDGDGPRRGAPGDRRGRPGPGAAGLELVVRPPQLRAVRAPRRLGDRPGPLLRPRDGRPGRADRPL
ncbi:MAG: Transcriptional regulator, AcrR family, partial [uncultured Blastococcus sp.]